MKKSHEIARGKTKVLYELEGQPDVLVVQQQDAITAGDGARRDVIDGKHQAEPGQDHIEGGGRLAECLQVLLEEFDDLQSAAPTLIAFGATVHRLALKHVPLRRYSRLVRVMHYSDYVSKEAYRLRVFEALA